MNEGLFICGEFVLLPLSSATHLHHSSQPAAVPIYVIKKQGVLESSLRETRALKTLTHRSYVKRPMA